MIKDKFLEPRPGIEYWVKIRAENEMFDFWQFLDFCICFASACNSYSFCNQHWNLLQNCRNMYFVKRQVNVNKNNTPEIIFHVVLLLGSLARQIDVQGEGLTQHWCLSDTVRATSVWTAEKKAQCQEVCSFLCSDSQCLSWGECHDFQTPNKDFDTD